jgi:hypothetical protein
MIAFAIRKVALTIRKVAFAIRKVAFAIRKVAFAIRKVAFTIRKEAYYGLLCMSRYLLRVKMVQLVSIKAHIPPVLLIIRGLY